MYIRRDALLQNGEQIRNYNNLKKIFASLGEMRVKEGGVLVIFLCESH